MKMEEKIREIFQKYDYGFGEIDTEKIIKDITTELENLKIEDIRNKLTPFKNLISMLENGFEYEKNNLVKDEIINCKNSIKYLSSLSNKSGLDLEELSRKLDEALSKETTESLMEYFGEDTIEEELIEMDKSILEEIISSNPDTIFLKSDGFDEAVLGYDEASNKLIYSIKKCIKKLMEDGMSHDEAYEFFEFNVRGSKGDDFPIWCEDYFL